MRLGVRTQLARLAGDAPAADAHRGWTATDRYICEQLRLGDPATDAALAASEAAGLPPIAVNANQGKLLELLARLVGARRILELGTLGGYSTIWLARGLAPGGQVVTLEADARFAEVARANIQRAGVGELVEIRVGPALESLPALAGGEPFDMFFLDADKGNYPTYLEWVLKLSRPGSLVIADNVVGGGAIVDPSGREPWGEEGGIAGVRRLYELLGSEPRLDVTAVQTVGERGHDGFALAIVGE